MKYFIITICLLTLFSCQSREKKFENLLKEWQGKGIIFPRECFFTLFGEDTLNFSIVAPYKLLSYVDTTGCISCKLQLRNWKHVIEELNIPVLFFMHPKSLQEMRIILRRNDFEYPVCIDVKDSLNKLNHFPSDMMFQTFLLDKRNKVVAIGNPIHNQRIKELYLNIIQGKEPEGFEDGKGPQTTVEADTVFLPMGTFNWQEEQKASFRLKNTGNKLLVIQQVNTSCGCTTVEYSPKSVAPGKEVTLTVTYKAKQPGYFNKAITVYCNAKNSPVMLRISGEAE